MRVLVIHPNLSLAGGDFVTIEVCKSLLDAGHKVKVASETFNIKKGEESWGMGSVMRECDWHPLDVPLFSRGKSFQRLFSKNELRDVKADLVFHTQLSTFRGPKARTVSFAYHPGDLSWFFRTGNVFNRREIYYRLIRRLRQ